MCHNKDFRFGEGSGGYQSKLQIIWLHIEKNVQEKFHINLQQYKLESCMFWCSKSVYWNVNNKCEEDLVCMCRPLRTHAVTLIEPAHNQIGRQWLLRPSCGTYTAHGWIQRGDRGQDPLEKSQVALVFLRNTVQIPLQRRLDPKFVRHPSPTPMA